jgi:hypothetical protein
VDNRFIVYPNPANTEVYVSMNADKAQSLSLKVIDASGRTVLDQQRQIQKGSNVFSVNTPGIQKGNYILQIVTGGQTSAIKFSVVN